MNIKLLRFIDKYIIWFFVIIFFPLKYIFTKNRKNLIKKPKKILVIRLWALWSSLLTFPMIKQLRDYYWNKVQYDLLHTSRNKNVYKNQWYFRNFYNLFNLKDLFKLIFSFKKYDIVIDAEDYFKTSALFSIWLWKINIWYSNIKTRWLAYNSKVFYNDKQHALVTFLDLLFPLWIKYKIPKQMEKFIYRKKDLEIIEEILKRNKNFLKICLHTGWAESSPERFWSLDNWIQLIKMILDNKKVKIFLSGTNFEKKSIEYILDKLENNYKKDIIDLFWKLNLNQFAYFLEDIDLMISNDTWAMHLSACMWTKTMWLFWPNLPERFWPYPQEKNLALYKWDGKAYINVHLWKFEKCSSEIINKITPKEVYEKIILSFKD